MIVIQPTMRITLDDDQYSIVLGALRYLADGLTSGETKAYDALPGADGLSHLDTKDLIKYFEHGGEAP